MSDFKKVLESVDLPDELKNQIQESWDAEVQANYDKVSADTEQKIKERVDEEVGQLVEAADALITSTLKAEMSEMSEQRKQVKEIMDKEHAKAVQQRVHESREFKRNSELLENLITQVLDTEIRELISERNEFKEKENKMLEQLDTMLKEGMKAEMQEFSEDRKALKESLSKMDNLVVGQLTRELSEFQTDRRALKEKASKLDKQYHKQLEEAKQAFMNRAGKSISTLVDSTLREQITELKEDIQIAKNNTFGRKIFEAFAGEYLTSHLSEGTELHKLRRKIEESNKNVAKMQEIIQEKEEKLNKSKEALRESREMSKRKDVMNNLLRPLNNTQRETMKQLLDGVETSKLEESFKRYVPTILENSGSKKRKERKVMTEQKSEKPVLSESKGERSKMSYQPTLEQPDDSDEYDEIFRLAGVKNK